MSWLWPALAFLALLAGLAVWRAFRSPEFYLGLVSAIFKAALPYILKGVAPKDLTAEQKDKIARGENPTLAGQGSGKFNHHKD